MKNTLTPISERMLGKFTVGDSCWEWTAAKTGGGYGYINRGRRGAGLIRAHRLVYEALIGPIPVGTELDHLCRNPSCVNPGHLEPVLHRENMLRGLTVAAQHAAVTHCPSGHEYTPENTRMERSGHRHCRACNRDSKRALRLAKLGVN